MFRRIFVVVVVICLAAVLSSPVSASQPANDSPAAQPVWSTFWQWLVNLFDGSSGLKGGSIMDPNGLVAPGSGGSAIDPNGFSGTDEGGVTESTSSSGGDEDGGSMIDPNG
jgi:hypothetical protein